MEPNTLYGLLYLEINLMAVTLILVIRHKSEGISKMVAQRNFRITIDAQILFFLSDTAYVLMKCGFIPASPVFIMIAKTLYFFSTALMCYFWFIYFEYLQDSPFTKNRRSILLASNLVLVTGILLFINLFTGILFYVDSAGLYQRGPLFAIQYLLSYIYVLTTCFRALLGVFNPKLLAKRNLLISLALFPLVPAGAGIFQFIYPELPLACAALSIATLLLYLNWMDEVISVDPLTQLNNRKQMTVQYDIWHKSADHNPIWLMIIDANHFKQINDRFGHIEGDAALVRIASAIRLACRNFAIPIHISRYGGDEFIALIKTNSAEMVRLFAERIQEELQLQNEEAHAPYQVTVSTGWARDNEKNTLEQLIASADKQMYLEKEKVHGKR